MNNEGNVQVSETVKPRRFSLKKNTEDIEIELENGPVQTYTIQEMTGAERDTYFKTVTGKAQFDGNGNLMKVNDPTGLYAALICLCMFDQEKKRVDQKFVNNLRSSVQGEIFEICSRVNGLDKMAADRAKND